jgi:hypothetical protein
MNQPHKHNGILDAMGGPARPGAQLPVATPEQMSQQMELQKNQLAFNLVPLVTQTRTTFTPAEIVDMAWEIATLAFAKVMPKPEKIAE